MCEPIINNFGNHYGLSSTEALDRLILDIKWIKTDYERDTLKNRL